MEIPVNLNLPSGALHWLSISCLNRGHGVSSKAFVEFAAKVRTEMQLREESLRRWPQGDTFVQLIRAGISGLIKLKTGAAYE